MPLRVLSRPGAPAIATPVAARRAWPALLSLALVAVGAGWLIYELGHQAITSVRIAGEFHNLDRVEFERAVEPHLDGSFFTTDVATIRSAARQLPWVRESSVRRVWPGAIHIAVVEREAVFRWGEASLMEADATTFTPADASGFGQLPLLAGPPGTEADVVDRFHQLEAQFAPLGQHLAQVTLSERGAWRAVLGSGVVLLLGRDPAPGALTRLLNAFPAVIAPRLYEAEQVDLRYANGFAVRWRPNAPPTANQGQAS